MRPHPVEGRAVKASPQRALFRDATSQGIEWAVGVATFWRSANSWDV
jgi:hypothetical protein